MLCFPIAFQLILRIYLLFLLLSIIEEVDVYLKIKEIKKLNHHFKFLSFEEKLSILSMEKYENK